MIKTVKLVIDAEAGIIDRIMSNGSVRKKVGSINSNGYLVMFHNGSMRPVHRILWESTRGAIPKGFEIDHINGFRLDNRIENLRLVTSKQNKENQHRAQSTNTTSGVKGVSWHRRAKKWCAQISHNSKIIYLGLFATIDEAKTAYNRAAAELHQYNPHAQV